MEAASFYLNAKMYVCGGMGGGGNFRNQVKGTGSAFGIERGRDRQSDLKGKADTCRTHPLHGQKKR